MPESPEALYARIAEQVGADGRLPMSPTAEWEIFPWQVVDGTLVPKVVGPPVAQEPPRMGESGGEPCGTCAEGQDDWIWRNDRWYVAAKRSGLPLALSLNFREHIDFTELDDELAAEFGRISVWLCRIMSNLEHIGRVHVNRWGDGSAHLHVWFFARPARMTGIRGSTAVEWEDLLPPPPEEIWRADLSAVAQRLAAHDGKAMV